MQDFLNWQSQGMDHPALWDQMQLDEVMSNRPTLLERAGSTPEDEDLDGSWLNTDGNQPSAENDKNPRIDDLDESNQRDRANLEDESIEYMDDVVDNSRQGEITKLKALSNIISILKFNPSRTNRAKDVAIEYYAKTLNEVEALASSAVKRGKHTEVGLQSNHTQSEWHEPRNIDADQAIDELISQISQDSNKSKRGNSPSPSINDGDADEPSNKKRRVFESELPWYNREEEARWSGNKDCEESRWILQLFARDYKVVQQWVQNLWTAPLRFPSSEWDNIIKGQAVNLSKNEKSGKVRQWTWNSQVILLHDLRVVFPTFTWPFLSQIHQVIFSCLQNHAYSFPC